MKFISVRDFRSHSSAVWRDLSEQRELVITKSSKPIAIVSAIDEHDFEHSLMEIRQARALQAVKRMQESSLAEGCDKLSAEDIDREIATVRTQR